MTPAARGLARGGKAAALLLVLAPAAVRAHSFYLRDLPNGESVPGRPALGHVSTGGGGTLNAFGKDFRTHGRTWSRALCELDSDGDGRTNGEELGDPSCVWRIGQTPEFTTGLTHPGVPDEPAAADGRKRAPPADGERAAGCGAGAEEACGEGGSGAAPRMPAWVWTHAALMTLAWAVIAPAGVAFALGPIRRRLRAPRWFRLHRAAQLAATTCAVAGGALALASMRASLSSAHGVLGLAVCAGALAQAVGGLLRPPAHASMAAARPARAEGGGGGAEEDDDGADAPRAKPRARELWELAHRFFAIVLLAAAVASLGLGGARAWGVYAPPDSWRAAVLAAVPLACACGAWGAVGAAVLFAARRDWMARGGAPAGSLAAALHS